MSYAGIARNDGEREQALMLAAASFYPSDSSRDAAILRKAFLLHEHPGYTKDSPIVVCAANGSVAASAFLIDCILPMEDRLLQGVFISSVSVAESARGQGLSLLLMDVAVKAAISRGVDIAIVIARRAVDGYYTRFGFWGLAQYSKLTLQMATLPKHTISSRSILARPATSEDLKVCAAMHVASYESLAGYCLRKPEMWSYILRKLPYLGMRLDMVTADGEIAGYAIHDDQGHIHEITTVLDVSVCSAHAFLTACTPGNEFITLHIPPTHAFLTWLEGADLSLTLRECPYGGHMARILNLPAVGSSLKTITDDAGVAGAHLSFSETIRRLGLSRITDSDSSSTRGSRGSFNILLLDQI